MHRVTNLFVGNGSALPANNAAPTPATIARLGIFGSDMQALDPAGNDTVSTAGGDAITFFQELANGDLKKSMALKGGAVTSAKGKHYVPARRQVCYIGYRRAAVVDGVTTAATGSIEVNNSTEYNFGIRFKWDKSFYSERPEVLNISFTSAAAATQSNIADQIVSAINNSAYGNTATGIKCVKAVKVGNGAVSTGPSNQHGLTAATNFGVEIWGLDVNQFTTSTYKPTYVNFSVFVNDASGFGTTTTAGEIQSKSEGIGTYNQVSNMENYLAQFDGVSNRRMWPAQTVTLSSSSTPVNSANVAAAVTSGTGNVTAVAVGDDYVAVATTTAGIRPGELILVDSVAYEVMYVMSTTVLRIVDTATAIYAGGANLKVRYFYNIITLEFADKSFTAGPDVTSEARKSIIIATPAIDAGAADPFDDAKDSADTSAEGIDLLDVLNKWLESTPLAPLPLTYAY